jgi:hypothetical protein
MMPEQFHQVRNELMQSLKALAPNQQFLIILYSDDKFPMYHPRRDVNPTLVSPTSDVLSRVESWLTGFKVWGDPNPMPAMELAFKLKPDAIFLLAAGKFDADAVAAIKQANSTGIRIHAVGLFNDQLERLLKPIARQNGGEYRFIE